MNPKMMKEMMDSEMCKEMMPEMIPKVMEKYLMNIPKNEREEFIKKIVNIIVSKSNECELSATFIKDFETSTNIKGLKINSKGGKGATKDSISPMDLFLSGLCGCVSIAVGRALSEKEINGNIKVDALVKKSFEKGCIEKIILNIHAKIDDSLNEDELKELILKGSKKCLISNSLGCEIEKNIVIE
ncbi:OsmC family protein [Methanococcus aeolicus]|uniref:OsmC family protein n=1 Tax=Methanococcus aeolicus TaxID=42879 RepID=UPI0021C9A45A|nr:OsmC family protein [Methanococcus aeolicus]UXM84141.1 OsmC family protein [Methanococcus aeolicus]